ncbi:MAG: aminoglycoside phosphotransferase family protein [Alphaproteobacteria bacterium]|nr:aminoglycoside phosphotransferase family protein [Alphaproteobacteria bacterium]
MGFLFQEPIGREARPAWAEVPPALVAQLQELLKQKIIHADIAWGGYSPSATFVATLASWEKAFIKGTHPGQDTHGTQMLRQEIEAYQTLPDIQSFSPAYLGCVSDGREEGWMLAAFDSIDTLPTLPWTEEKITTVFRLLSRLHFCDKKNIPPALPPARDKNYIEKFLRPEGGWLRFRDERQTADKFLALFEDQDAGRDWLSSALPRLCEKQAKAHMTGGAVGMLHQDLRSDNILFDREDRAYLVDWVNACQGPVVMDLAQFLPAVSAESAFECGALLGLYEKISGVKIDRESLVIALASASGHMADNAYRAVPAKLPRLRWMQKSVLWAMLQWAVVLMDIPPPPRFTGPYHD